MSLGFLDKLLSENDIAFLKMGLQPQLVGAGMAAVAPDEEKNVYIDAINNLYSILAELRRQASQG